MGYPERWVCIEGGCRGSVHAGSMLRCLFHDNRAVRVPPTELVPAPLPTRNRKLTRKLQPAKIEDKRGQEASPIPVGAPVAQRQIDDFCVMPSCHEPVAARDGGGGSGIFCTEHS